jgi:uncharacterized membrane protein YgcG
MTKRKIGKSRWRWQVILAFFVLVGGLAPGDVLAKEKFVVDQYNVVMNVEENHNYQISEDLRVTFTQPGHGLVRKIPFTGKFIRQVDGYLDRSSYYARVSDIVVPNWNSRIEGSEDSKLVRIGTSYEEVTGPQQYQINYNWNPGLDDLDSMDDVYYNLIGTDWDTTIAGGTFVINMPKAFDPAKVEFIAGESGTADMNAVDFTVSGNTITGTLKRPLAPYESLTLKINLPQGYFQTTFWGEFMDLFMNNGQDQFLLFMMVIPLFIGGAIWLIFGRDKKAVEPVSFYPPEGFTPPQIGYMVDGKITQRELMSLLLYWAAKGYVSMKAVSDSRYDFKKLKELPATAWDFEHTLFNGIFAKSKMFSTVALPETLYDTVTTAMKELEAYFLTDETRVMTDSSRLVSGGIVVMMAFPFLGLGFTALSKIGQGSSGGMLMFISSLFFMGLMVASIALLSKVFEKLQGVYSRSSNKMLIIGLLLGGVAIQAIVSLFWRYTGSAGAAVALVAIAGIYVLAWLRIISGRFTKKGNRWAGEILGLKRFIVLAEKDRLEELVKEDPQYFFKILPYAYVLGVTNEWVADFTSLLVVAPDWYNGTNAADFYPSRFTTDYFDHLHTVSSQIRPPVVQPVTDYNSDHDSDDDSFFGGFGSGGGGGFSSGGGTAGGGGGGGGGSSW